MFYPQRRVRSRAHSQQDANALHRLAAHCHARRFTQSNLRALQAPMSETTPGTEPPASPFRRTSPMCRRKGRLEGVKRGIRNHIGVLSPFYLRRQTAASPGRRRRQLCTLTLRVKPPPAEGLPSAEGKEKKKREFIPTSPRPPDSTRPSPVCRSARPAFSSACRPRAAFPSCPRRRRGTRATHSRGSSRR